MQQRTTKQFTISLPPDMAEMVVRTAKAESRTISELFREAFRAYRSERVRRLIEEANARSRARNHNGYTPDDVEHVIDEVRAEQRAEKGKAQ